jgi:hypothetical protein
MLGSHTHSNESSETSADSGSQPRIPMATRLIEADRRAVDCILDGQASAPDAGNSFPSFDPVAQIQFQHRIAAVQRWFALMGVMPAEDPSPDLLLSTLNRLDQLRAAQAAGAPPEDTATGLRL